MLLNAIRLLNVDEPLASGNRFLAAASGLAKIGETCCVIGDDEAHLALFHLAGDAPGTLLRLLPGKLPRKKKKRKAVKPDFEILFALPDNRLCALGSGSTEKRMRAAIINPTDETVVVRDIHLLFAALAPLVTEINLEGAVLIGERLLLFNRGNLANPGNAVFETTLAAITGGDDFTVALAASLTLPMVGNAPLTVTDACALGDGHILLSAVAEVTDDSYADGDILGAAIVRLSPDLAIVAVEPIEPVVKIEGIWAERSSTSIALLCVSDADDPDTPSSLYTGTVRI